MLGADRPVVFLDPGLPARPGVLPERPPVTATPLISCIMASRGKLFPARHAIDCFRHQDYARRELVIATAAADDALAAYVAGLDDRSIRLIRVRAGATVSELRNDAIAACAGELLCVWDDDDLSHPQRLSSQHRLMRSGDARGCFLARVLLWWPERRMLAMSCPRIWENTMLVERAVFPPYPADQPRGEDTAVVLALRAEHRLLLGDVPEAYCYIAHGTNLWDAEHFAMLFRGASRSYAGTAYDEVVAELSAGLPMAGYAAGQAARRAGTAAVSACAPENDPSPLPRA